jgi:hypothetical protein
MRDYISPPCRLFISIALTHITVISSSSSSSSFADKVRESQIPDNRNLDRFNYYATNRTVVNGEFINDFGPDEWQKIECADTETCVSLIQIAT